MGIKIQNISFNSCGYTLNEINKWIKTPAENEHINATVNFNPILIPEDIRNRHQKSQYVRESCRGFLLKLNICFKEPFEVCCSRTEFVRIAILLRTMHELPEMKYKAKNLETKETVEVWLEKRNKKIIRRLEF